MVLGKLLDFGQNVAETRLIWLQIFITIRDERRQRAMRLIEKRKAEANSL